VGESLTALARIYCAVWSIRMKARYTIVGLGELLWDLLPEGRHLGGAPANFAYFSNVLGDQGVVASRVGNDALGRETIEQLKRLRLDPSHVQRDNKRPTGTVPVIVSRSGQPDFIITRSVAWDFLQMTPLWRALARSADAVCFGSLAQRSPRSRKTIRDFLRCTRLDTLRVFDVNLRQQFYSPTLIANSLGLADVVKLNHQELPRIMEMLELPYAAPEAAARRLLREYGLRLVCVTRGSRGSLLVSAEGKHRHSGFRIRVADTIGAGDAFTAALVHHYLRGASLAGMNEAANSLGSWVASQSGATPVPTAVEKAKFL
jgi:fructokinase